MSRVILMILLCLSSAQPNKFNYKAKYNSLSKRVKILEATIPLLQARIENLEDDATTTIPLLQARIENLENNANETDIYGNNDEDYDLDISDSSSIGGVEKTFNKSRSDYATLDDVYKLLEGDNGSDYRNVFFAALDCYTTDLRDNRVHDNSTADVLPLNVIMKDIENTSEAPYTTPRSIYTPHTVLFL